MFSIFLLWLNILTPYMPGDDFLYMLKFPEVGYIGEQPISSFSEYFESLKNHYQNYNYRVFPHAILQVILLLPPWIFDLLNTLCFLSIPYVLINGVVDKKPSVPLYLLVLLFIWIFHFDLGRSYFWTTGSLNYSWMLLIQLVLITKLLNFRNSDNQFSWSIIGLGILCATTNENVVLTLFLLTSLLAIESWVGSRKVNWSLVITSVILLLGGALMLSSPSLDIRLEKEGFKFDDLSFKIIEYFRRVIFYIISFAPVLLFFLFSKKKKSFGQDQIFISLGIIISMLAMFLAPLFEPRSAIFPFCLTIMLVLSMINGSVIKLFWLATMVAISLLIFVERLPLFMDLEKRHNDNAVILNANVNSQDTVFLNRYCQSSKYSCLICDDITDDPEYMDNEPLAAFYNIYKVSLKKDQALFYKWNDFRQKINQEDTFGYQKVDIKQQHINPNIVLNDIRLKSDPSGISFTMQFEAESIPEDYIVILRGSKKGINRYRIIDLLPRQIRLYFLDYLEYQASSSTITINGIASTMYLIHKNIITI